MVANESSSCHLFAHFFWDPGNFLFYFMQESSSRKIEEMGRELERAHEKAKKGR